MRVENPFLIRTAGRVASIALRGLFGTLRRDLHMSDSYRQGKRQGDNRYLYSVWHDSAVIATFGRRHERMVALTSRHRDGTFVASIVNGVGVRSVRGSSGRSGQSAARELMQTATTDNIVMTPDGPRGPRRKMSRGIVYLASRTGNAVVPTGFACSNAWDIPGSWTTLTIPKPFSRVVLLIGEPIEVPASLTEEGMLTYTDIVQQAMDELQVRAVRLVDGSRPTKPTALVEATILDKAA